MTANQINYFKAREEQRHNLVQEAVERSKASAALGQSQAALTQADAAQKQAATSSRVASETQRHNLEGERINWFSSMSGIEETRRHNSEQERINAMDAETRRMQQQQGESLIAQQIKSLQLDSTSKALQAEASLQSAHAAESRAAATFQSALASQISALAAQRSADIRAAELIELNRHNLQGEKEVVRHNKQDEMVNRRRATAYSEMAAASTKQAGAAETQAEAATSRAESERIRAIASAVDTGVNVFNTAVDTASKLAGSININRIIAGRRYLG